MVDLRQLEELASIGCPDEEIATILGVSEAWLNERKIDSPDFLERLTRGRSTVKRSLRRTQLNVALGEAVSHSGKNGVSYHNPTQMLVWLGKQLLGQRDQPEPARQQSVAEPIALGVDRGNGVEPVVVHPGASLADIRATVDVTQRPAEGSDVAASTP